MGMLAWTPATVSRKAPRESFPLDPEPARADGFATRTQPLSHRADAMLMAHYPLGFRMALHHKDLGIALDAAGDVNLDLPVTQLVANLENDLLEQGYGNEDVSALHRLYGSKS